MLRLCLLLSVFFSFYVQAQEQPFDLRKLQEMMGDPESMQRQAELMAKEMQATSSCMEQAGLKKMEEEGRAMQARIQSLCRKGDRGGAEEAAMNYSMKVMSSAEFKQLKECTENMKSYIPEGFMQELQKQANLASSTENENAKKQHICDMQ